MAPDVSSSSNVRILIAVLMNAFQDIPTLGCSWKRGEDELENGQIVSACFVGLLERECAGFGMSKIMSGLGCTRSTKDDGCMLTLVKRPGTNRCSTRKVFRPLILLLTHIKRSAD